MVPRVQNVTFALSLGLLAFAALSPVAWAQSPSPGRGTASKVAVDPLSQRLQVLLTTPGALLPTAVELTVLLLEAGPERTATFLRQLEARAVQAHQTSDDTNDLAALGGRLRTVPALIDRTLRGAEVPGPMKNVGISVALEILRRDPQPAALSLTSRLVPMADATDAAGLTSIAGRLRECARAFASARVGTASATADFMRSVAPPLALSFVDGIAGAESAPYAALHLIRLLDKVEGFEGSLLNRIEGLARRRAVRLTADQCGAVRDRLRSGNAFVRREAAFAAGSLGDHRAINTLISLLNDPVKNVRNAAHDSLCRLTSMTISADPFRWRLWYERQEQWWQERGHEALASIPGAQLGELVDLISEASTKRLYRDEVATALMTLLDHQDDRYVELGLSGLGTIRAPMSVNLIRTFTASTNPRLAARASDALRALKGAGIDTAAGRSAPLVAHSDQETIDR